MIKKVVKIISLAILMIACVGCVTNPTRQVRIIDNADGKVYFILPSKKMFIATSANFSRQGKKIVAALFYLTAYYDNSPIAVISMGQKDSNNLGRARLFR